MKLTRSVRIPLLLPQADAQTFTSGAPVGKRWILASELTDNLNRLVPTLPPDARLEEGIHSEMLGTYLVLIWDEELPD